MLALLGAAGCAQKPVDARPALALPESWQGAVSEQALWPSEDWWQGFASGELSQLVERARRNNQDLAAAAARVLQAEAQARAAGASLLPGVSLDAGASRQEGDVSRTSLSAGLSASYEIDFWGRNRASRAASEASLLATRFDRETLALTVTSSVTRSYLQLLSLRDRLRVAQLNLDNAERVLALTEVRVRNGAASPLELAQQRSQVAQQRASLAPLRQQERETLLTLATLLGEPLVNVQVEGQTLTELTLPEVSPGLPSELLQRRPDIRRSEAQLAAAEANLAAARAALFPSVRLSASLAQQGSSLSGLLDANPVASLGSSLLYTIFDGGRLRAERDLAEARQLELVENYRGAVLSALADVESALEAVARTEERRRLQEDVLAETELALRLAEVRYREGAADLLTVLDAQRSHFQAQDQALQIRLAAFEARLDLFMALGGGW